MKTLIVIVVVLAASVVRGEDAVSASMRQKGRAQIMESVPVSQPASEEPYKDVVKMEPLVVVARPRVPSDRRVLSREGAGAVIKQEYPGASAAGKDPFRFDATGIPNYGALMFMEDERAIQRKEMTGFSGMLVRAGDITSGKELRIRVREVFIRNSDGLMRAMDESANRSRH